MSTEFWNGNMAAAQAVKRARVQLIAAYPITPQTHTVEYISQFVNDGELAARMEASPSGSVKKCGAMRMRPRTRASSA